MEDAKSERQRTWQQILALIIWGIGFQAAHVLLFAIFKADDYPAIAYAGDWSRVAHDFVGPQYDLHFFLFYRPLITLSLAVDYWFFGAEPHGFLAMNCLASILSALLIFGILKRLMQGKAQAWVAWGVAALWLTHPVLLHSTSWVVGRVDTHVALWILLALWFHLGRRRGGAAWPVWLFLFLAFMTKESALGAPLLLLGLDMLDPRRVEGPGPRWAGRRLLALPTLILIPAFLLLRKMLLGAALGGYGFLEAQSVEPLAISEGIWSTLSYAILPAGPMWVRTVLLMLAFSFAVHWIWRRPSDRTARLMGVLLVSAGLFGPLAPLLPSMRDPGQQRYAYLAVLWPWTVLGFACFARSPFDKVAQGALIVAVFFLVYLGRTQDQRKLEANDKFVQSVVATLHDADAAMGDPGSPLLLSGEVKLSYHPQRFLWGLGSVLKPPFWEGNREVLTLHKLHPLATEVTPDFLGQDLRGLVAIGPDGALPYPEKRWSVDPAPTVVPPVGFNGVLRPASIEELRVGERQGWPAGEGYQGQVAVCTGFGSFLLPIPAKDGQISLADLLLANVTFAKPGAINRVLDLCWNGFDLAKQSPISLYWRNSNGLQRAELRVSPDYAAWYWGLHR